MWTLGKLDPGLSKRDGKCCESIHTISVEHSFQPCRAETVLMIMCADKMALSKLQPDRETTGNLQQEDESSAVDHSMGGSHAR